jgi:predicted acyltransferase
VEAIYSPLKHAEWHGATPTDFIFPFFLFIVGIAIPIALGKRVEEGGISRDVYLKIFAAPLTIFLLGLFLAAFPFFDFAKANGSNSRRFAAHRGLLSDRFAYFYSTRIGNSKRLSASRCFSFTGLLMTLINVPGCEITTINDKACNLAAYLDRVDFNGKSHLEIGEGFRPGRNSFDHSGNRHDFGGRFVRHWLRKTNDYEKVAAMFFFGVVLTALGWAWNFWFPINKPLWTSSYVVYTAGLALCFLGFLLLAG